MSEGEPNIDNSPNTMDNEEKLRIKDRIIPALPGALT